MITVKAKLVGKNLSLNGHEELVFQLFDDSPNFFLFVVKFKNWQHEKLYFDEEGFLTYKEIKPGEIWFDGKDYHPYKYEMRQFINFIKLQQKIDDKKLQL